MATPHSQLAVYLNDHLAGALVAMEILDTLQRHDDSELNQFARELHGAIAADRDELLQLMRGAGIECSDVRRAVAWISEKATELKVRLDDPGDRGLRIFELLELVAVGIEGKRALWAALRTISSRIPSLRAADYARLAQRADEQRAAVETHRLERAMVALGGSAR